ncbi:hypothetical protein C6X94_03345 [Bacillus safensis]|nr:hypothetical protein C6X94_03345 [Bacillus safensis]
MDRRIKVRGDSVKREQKKVFISYSWTTDTLVDWVRNELATRLMEDGVEVILDQWDLKEGQDIFVFMESMVNDSSIDKVLIICENGYKEKANGRKGGVGTETQIITPKVYSEANQEKFIPIVAERDHDGKDFIPTYMESRKYIDLSNEELYHQNYEQLLRVIFERPANRKPQLGVPPEYIFEDEQINGHKLKSLISEIKKAMFQDNHLKVKTYTIEFKREFINSLEEFKIVDKDDHDSIAQEIENKIDNMLILKNDLINLMEYLITNEALKVDFLMEFFEEFFNQIIEIKSLTEGSYAIIQFDQYKFFIKEVFINVVMILLRHSNFQLLNEFLYSRYWVFNKYKNNGKTGVGFEAFNTYVQALDEIQVLKTGIAYWSYSAVKMTRRLPKNYTSNDFGNTDLILYYISCHKNIDDEVSRVWFPHGYFYSKGKIEMFQRMESKRFFEKIKHLFGVDDQEGFVKLVSALEYPHKGGYPGSFDGIPDINFHIDSESICKYK